MAIEIGKIELPLISKWACIYSRKGRARHLDMVQIYADGTIDRIARGSINLDAPLVLLNPDHPDHNPTRPSNIAMACDLFTDPTCYKFLRLIEAHIMTCDLQEAVDPLLYVIAEMDEQYCPTVILPLHYGEALDQLRNAHANIPSAPKPKPT